MLMTTSEGSLARQPISLSAGGHDEQPWLVNNSTTARVWAWAARMGSAQHHDINARTRQRRSIFEIRLGRAKSYRAARSPAIHMAVTRGEVRRRGARAARTGGCRRAGNI